MVHIYYRILLSHKKNEFESVELRWRSLEPIIHSKVSQKEKNKYYILSIYMEYRKMVLINLLQGRNRDTDIENGLVDTVVEE